MKKPSYFAKKFPMGSVSQKCEAEIVALNIMKILSRTGDKFRKLSFFEYEKERAKDGNFDDMEMIYFKRVIGYFKSSDTAELFSPAWKSNN